jgi:glycosyltransferase involved in cell wall biosynthesis
MHEGGMTQKLMVLVPDYLSHIVKKGELQPRYYNPGEVFDEVHLLMTTPDEPDPSALQGMVGRAKLFLYNHPEDARMSERPWWLFDNWLLRRWAKRGVDIARSISPQLIRCHGADWNTYLASQIKAALGTPYVVSLHINHDVNPTRRFHDNPLTRARKRNNILFDEIEREGLSHANLVMPVYQPIIPYLDRLGVRNYEVCYNVLNGENLRKKDNYRTGDRFRIVSVGRLFDAKYPDNLIRAVALQRNYDLTIVGDGPARASLERLVSDLAVRDRVHFRPAIVNDELCAALPTYDAFAIHSEYWEINKSLLEALLTGLPCVINRRRGLPVPELEDDFITKVENTVEGYGAALGRLSTDHAFREALGRRAFAHAQKYWAPQVAEARYANIYRTMLAHRAA